jgi:hypothetical protein
MVATVVRRDSFSRNHSSGLKRRNQIGRLERKGAVMFLAGLKFALGFDRAICAARDGRQTGAYCRTEMQAQTQVSAVLNDVNNNPNARIHRPLHPRKSIRRLANPPKHLTAQKIVWLPLAKVRASITGNLRRASGGQIRRVAESWTAGPSDGLAKAKRQVWGAAWRDRCRGPSDCRRQLHRQAFPAAMAEALLFYCSD